MSCGRKLGKALVHSKDAPPICDGCDALKRQLIEAVGLLRDYARIYPNNSGRTTHFLAHTFKGEA